MSSNDNIDILDDSLYQMSKDHFDKYFISEKVLGCGSSAEIRVGFVKQDITADFVKQSMAAEFVKQPMATEFVKQPMATEPAKQPITTPSVAVKIINKRNIDPSDLKNASEEANILSQLNHPHIVQIYGTYMDNHHIYLFLSLAHGGNLLSLLDQINRPLTPDEARHLCSQLIEAISYCHSKNIVHRDIKFDNLLLRDVFDIEAPIQQCNIMLCDFGFSVNQEEYGPHLVDYPGTLHYVSPEVVNGIPYRGRSSDIWSMGICLYALSEHAFPFFDKNDDYDEIKYCITTMMPTFKFITDGQLKDLILQMLTKNPTARIDMRNILCHPWMLDDQPNSTTISFSNQQ